MCTVPWRSPGGTWEYHKTAETRRMGLRMHLMGGKEWQRFSLETNSIIWPVRSMILFLLALEAVWLYFQPSPTNAKVVTTDELLQPTLMVTHTGRRVWISTSVTMLNDWLCAREHPSETSQCRMFALDENFLTSSIFVAQIGEPPQVSQSNQRPCHSK